MIHFLRKIRRTLIESGSARKYLLYAVGEIILVVIGILIALQINNWNETRKSKIDFKQTMLALAQDIRNDTIILQRHISSLQSQEKAAQLIIPILENRASIKDTIAFYLSLLEMSNSINMDLNTEVWDEIRKSGLGKAYAEPELIQRIQNYYQRYKRVARNWENEIEPRIEMRGLKYDLMDQIDLKRLRNPDTSNLPSQKALKAILNEKKVANLTNRIEFSSTNFTRIFTTIKDMADEILVLIDEKYGTFRTG